MNCRNGIVYPEVFEVIGLDTGQSIQSIIIGFELHGRVGNAM